MNHRLAARTAGLALAALAAVVLIPCPAGAGTLRFEEVAEVPQPTDIVAWGDAGLLVASQSGQIWHLAAAAATPEPFLDLGSKLAVGPEQGLLSLALDPQIAANGHFYLTYTRAGDGASVISRFSLAADPDRGDPASEEVLLTVPQPGPNHNVNQLRFGPDGHLYVAVGDGKLADEPPCSAQDGRSLGGKILRIDVGVEGGYAIPSDNPFVGDPSVRDEVWALGLRNPWRLSFDRLTGALFIADPGGQGDDAREEINIHPAAAPMGANFGWKMMEGSRCRGQDIGCSGSVLSCGHPRYALPAIEYRHDAPSRCAVIGGFVYRGQALPALFGAYVFGDYCGQLWSAWPDGGSWRLDAMAPSRFGITTFGEDAAGELIMATADGRLYRLVDVALEASCAASDETLCLVDGRFRVAVRWQTASRSGRGRAVQLVIGDQAGDRSGGWFWFFRPGNPEVFVKVINACESASRHFWVFAGGMTDVGVELTVTDTATGTSRLYRTQPGTPFGTIRDTRAFSTCP